MTTRIESKRQNDYMSALPNDCLANILGLLCFGDRKHVSLVSKQMLEVEGKIRRRLTLYPAGPDLPVSLLSRFDAFTELVIDGCHSSATDIIDVDEMLNRIGKQCGNRIVELVLSGVNVTCTGIESIAWRFKKLEWLTIGGRKWNIRDEEISCIASKCMGLKKLCEVCSVPDKGIKAFALGGCPDLVEIKVGKCRGVTSDVVGWLLGARRGSLVVNLDVGDQIGAGGLGLDSDSDGSDADGGGGLQDYDLDIW